ncbi:MAG TPA: NAD(P)H-dependent glycerol-3-phosphate dehydrogenase [Fimbriimonas sp.]|nr:NAD(P)H-dependent glycerol-3-phosphate dehydrogenase [Fimbriimonas sp.]
MRAAVVGAGSWGTALALLLARNGHDVLLLGRDLEEIEHMRTARENHRYLPGFQLPPNISPEDITLTELSAEITILAVPSGALNDVTAHLHGACGTLVVAAKGLEPESGRLLCDVVEEIVPGASVGVLSGPNLAVEIARGIPTVAVSAFKEEAPAEVVREAFSCRSFRVSTSSDVKGVELAGALKNVLAIGAGMSDGLGFGDNTKGAFLSRGLMEMAKLGLAMGAQMETFLGPAGVGDLFATAASGLSRNYRVGKGLGEGRSLEEVIAGIGQVAEGVPTSHAAMKLARENGVDMPVFAAVDAVVQGHLRPGEAVAMLMDRGR